MLLPIECQKLLDRKIYCETSPDTFVKAMSDSMPHLNKVFFEILINFDNEQLDK